MATKIYMYDGRLAASVPDGTLDTTSTSIKIPGNYYENYGQSVMESILWTMQNFAGDTSPTSPIIGQSWYDSAQQVMKTYNGNTWVTGGSVLVEDNQPIAKNKGELWYDTVNQQLKIWNGISWDIVGPLGSAINGDPISNLIVPNHSAFESVKLSDGVNSHQVWRWTIGGTVAAILSLDPVFTPTPPMAGYTAIYPGLNFNSNVSGSGISGDPTLMRTDKTNIPKTDNSYDLGTSSLSYRTMYSANAVLRTSLGVGGTAGSYAFRVTGTSNFTSTAIFLGKVGVGSDPGTYGLKVDGTSRFGSAASFASTAAFSSTVSFGSTASLAAGTATAAPILFASGPLLTSADAGAIEFNGSGFFVTVNVGSTPTRKTVLTSGNVVIANSGDSAAAPGITWADSLTTGIFNPGSAVAITTSGTEKIRVNASGAIGIGGTNFGNSGEALVSNGSGSPVDWAQIIPPGAMMPYAGSTPPTGWLLCYGQSLSTTTYANLFAAIGYTHGGSGGSFNLPDLRGRVIAGKDNMGGTSANRLTTAGSGVNGDVLGTSGGEETHLLNINEMPLHGHPWWSSSTTQTSLNSDANGGFVHSNSSDALRAAYTGVPASPLGQQIGGEGGSQPHNNVQPTFILNYIIKT